MSKHILAANDPTLRLNSQITFGKYQGQLVENVVKHNPDYIHWLITNNVHKFHTEVLTAVLVKKCKYTQRRYTQMYYGDLQGDLAHETMTQIQMAVDDDYAAGFDDVPF